MSTVVDLNHKCLISHEQLLLLSAKVVDKYAFSGAIPSREKEDVKMAIIEKFLTKQNKIVNNFKGESKVSTYCIAVLNRMCCEIIRSNLKHWNNAVSDIPANTATSHLSTSEKFVIKDEINLLHKTLITIGLDYYKLITFLAYYYKLPPKIDFVSNYDKAYVKNNLLNILTVSNDSSKGTIFTNLSHIVNLAEHKDVKADAVRMWLNKNINKLISRLNSPFNRATYDKESFQILFEYLYTKTEE